MPYKTNGADVPERAAKLSASKRRQFAAVFNSSFEQCMGDATGDDKRAECEATAYAQAYGVVKSEEGDMGKREAEESTAEVVNLPDPPDDEQELDVPEEGEPLPEEDGAGDGAEVTEELPVEPQPQSEAGGVQAAIEHLKAALEALSGQGSPEPSDDMPEPPMEAEPEEVEEPEAA